MSAAAELLELFEEATVLARQVADEDPHFRAYHLASFEGKDAGWLGDGFLIDAVRKLASARWVVLDDDGDQVAGPFDSEEECERWAERQGRDDVFFEPEDE